MDMVNICNQVLTTNKPNVLDFFWTLSPNFSKATKLLFPILLASDVTGKIVLYVQTAIFT